MAAEPVALRARPRRSKPRVDVVRPGLTIVDTDDQPTRAAKAARRRDPLEAGRFLGNDATSGRPLYLANEYTLLAAAVPRFGNKTTRYVIPAVADARGAVLTTSTRLDVAEITYDRRAAIGPTHIFEPQGEIRGVPRMAFSYDLPSIMRDEPLYRLTLRVYPSWRRQPPRRWLAVPLHGLLLL